MKNRRAGLTVMETLVVIAIIAIALGLLLGGFTVIPEVFRPFCRRSGDAAGDGNVEAANRRYLPRQPTDTSGLVPLSAAMPPWKPDASLEEISNIWGARGLEKSRKSTGSSLTADLS